MVTKNESIDKESEEMLLPPENSGSCEEEGSSLMISGEGVAVGVAAADDVAGVASSSHVLVVLLRSLRWLAWMGERDGRLVDLETFVNDLRGLRARLAHFVDVVLFGSVVRLR